jgi:hypothetical protein
MRGAMTMHSAIFVAEYTDAQTDFAQFLSTVATKLKDQNCFDRIAENVWLVNFQMAPGYLGWLIALCERQGISYRILPLADAPQWLPVGTGPKPI